ncbi:hypothetical protein TKK_0006578 [Trichogramma kaykai]|uniref:RING-type domain-containing protein n=1 Tax=Trichogramma kaykai TaxID=54128 RepID=A0ABD2XDF8_9HYME
MNYEANRIATFQHWPVNAIVHIDQLAKAGFYYTGRAQEVQCFLCGIRISVWNYTDQAMAIHRASNPECPIVLDPNTNLNVPLSSATNDIRPSSRNSNHRENSEWDSMAAQRTNLLRYNVRLNTFENWPYSDKIAPERLARSGFFYTQEGDMVECAYCRGVILKWEPGDDPDTEHIKNFPHCDFQLRREENLDLSCNIQFMPGTTSSFAELGVQYHTAPKQPKHATYEGRLNTFTGWPTHKRQKPDMLADAGFYYVGQQDQVRCFHCDGGLRNWEETDDPWIEHAKWFPKCGYVGLIKGQDFIKQSLENRPPVDQVMNNTGEAAESQMNPVLPVDASLQLPRQVTDAELDRLLGTPPALTALELGLHVGRVKMALKRRIERVGAPYENADQLIEDATQIQLMEENSSSNVAGAAAAAPESPSAELTQLLNQIITTAETTNSMSEESARMIESEQFQTPSPDRRKETLQTVEVETQVEEVDTKTEKIACLEEENRKLREARLCKICMDREVAVVFLPCGHLSTCEFCAPSLTQCPMCRQEIRATVRTFLV